jgi:multiple sugar transport system permease protein
MTNRHGLTSISAYFILVLLGLFFLVPLLWPILASFNPSASLSVTIPAHFSLTNYQTILSNGLVVGPFGNSLILAVSTMLLVMISRAWQRTHSRVTSFPSRAPSCTPSCSLAHYLF